jgi:hypothetical protein
VSREDHSYSEAWVRAAGQGHVLRIAEAFLSGGPPQLLGLVPDKASTAFQMNLDLAAGYDAVVDMLIEMGTVSAEDVHAQMDMTKTQLGFDPRNDVMANLSGGIAFFQAPVQDESEAFFMADPEEPINYVLLAGLKDGAKMTTLIDSSLQQSGLHAVRKREEFMGHTVYAVPVMPFGEVHYAVLDDLAVASLSSELLQDVLRRHGASDLPSVRTHEDVAGALERLGEDQSLYLVSDAATAIKGMLKGFAMELEAARARGDDVAEAGMPPLSDLVLPGPDVVDKYFKRPAVSTMRLGPAGFQFQSLGP